MTENVKKIKYLLYARKSTESEDRQVLSIDSQVDELKRIAEREGIHIVDTLIESRSAKTLGRPVFNDLIDRLVAGKADGILCWKLDRLARNFIDGGRIIEMLQHGVIRHIRAFEHNYYPQDNVLLMSVEFGMANQFSRDLAVNVTRGMRRKAEMGWYPVQPPIGYLNSKTKGRGKNDISKDPKSFALVRKVWDFMLTGTYNVPKILALANDDWGLRTRKGNKVAQSTIHYTLTNPFYYGAFEWPRRSGNWYQGSHEPMISVDEYDRMQIILGRKGHPRPKTHVFAFTGIMKCGGCGAAITAEDKHKLQLNGNLHKYIYYHCTKRKDPTCTQKSLEEKKLTEQIDEKLVGLVMPDQFHAWAMKWLEQEHHREVESRESIRATQMKAYDEVVSRLDRYIEMRVQNELTEEEFKEKKNTALKEKLRLNELLNDTDHRISRWAENMENGLKFVWRAREKFKNGTLEEKKEIFSALGSNFFLEYRKLLIDMDETLLPMEKLSLEVKTIHSRLEPRKKAYTQTDFEQIYARNPIVCAQLDSNQRPFA